MIKIFDTEKGYRYMVPLLRKAGVDIDIKNDIIIGKTLSGLVSLMDSIQRDLKPDPMDKFMKAILYGNTGSGKTRTSLEMIIGLVKEKTNLPILFIDSASAVYQNYVEAFKSRNGIKKMYMNHWGEVIPAFNRELGSRIRDYDYNIILTGRVGFVYEMVENEETGKKEFQKTDTKAKLSSEIAYEPDLVIEMEQLKSRNGDGSGVEVVQQAVVLKDRADIIHGKSCINPDWSFFKPVWDYLDLEKMESPPTDTYSDHDIIDTDNDRYKARAEKDIILEKIWGEFDSMGLGSTKEGKTVKMNVFERIFMTKSKTEVEKMNTAQLEDAHMRLLEDTDVIKYKHLAQEALNATT